MTVVGPKINAFAVADILNKADKDHNGVLDGSELSSITAKPDTAEKQYIATNLNSIKGNDRFVTAGDWVSFQHNNMDSLDFSKRGKKDSYASSSYEATPPGQTSQDAGNPFQVISL